jgi:hypothetical protein
VSNADRDTKQVAAILCTLQKNVLLMLCRERNRTSYTPSLYETQIPVDGLSCAMRSARVNHGFGRSAPAAVAAAVADAGAGAAASAAVGLSNPTTAVRAPTTLAEQAATTDQFTLNPSPPALDEPPTTATSGPARLWHTRATNLFTILHRCIAKY